MHLQGDTIQKSYKTVPLSQIKPYPNNPRINDAAAQDVAKSIEQCGYIAPIVVDEDMVILAGHTRLKGLQILGRESADVVICSGLTDEQKRKYRLLDNRIGEEADWNFDLLEQELADLDFGDLELDWGIDDIRSEDFGTDFSLPDGDKPEICQMTFTLHNEQKSLIEYALSIIGDDVQETFGNTNKNGNALYEVVRQWAEQRK